jgi:cytochrome P450 family 9
MTALNWMWSLTDWVLLLLAAGFLLYVWSTRTYSRFTRPDIPHIKPFPLVGTMGPAILKAQPFTDMIQENYNQLEGSPYGVIFIFRQPGVLLRDLELIKTVAIKDFEYFTDHRNVFPQKDTVWSKALINLTGQRWKDMRSTLSPAFTSSKMKTMFVLMSECCQQLVNFLEQCYQQPPQNLYHISKEGDLLILELKDMYTRCTTDVIATTAFGLKVDSLQQPTNKFYVKGQEATNFGVIKWCVALAFPKIMKLLGMDLVPGNITEFFRTLVLDTVATREREGIVRPDMLQLLIEAKKGTLHDENSAENQKSTKIKLDDEDIISQALVFFLAGFDTTSTLLCFVCYELATHPDVQKHLQEEIDKTMQENGGKFTYEAIHSMKYLDMVVSETLRLYPPGGAVDRLCVKNYTLKCNPPLELRPGDGVLIPLYALQRDPNYFPEPDRFDPERFSDENRKKINPMTYLPFGVGPRICIGNRFALMEVKSLLAHLLSHFNIKVVPKTPVPIKIVQKGFILSVKGGFWMGLEKRNT